MAQQRILAVAVTVLLWAVTAAAHHPFNDEYDRTNTVTLTGTVTKIDWQNPHVYVYLDVKDNNRVNNWKVEMGSPDALTKEGWTQTSVKPGEQVTVQGWRAKAGSNLANANSFTMANGKRMAAASSFDQAAPEGQLAQNFPAEQQRVGTTGADPAALPATASPLALYAALGALALAGALGLRAFRG